jgi:hypothetical protein
MESDPGLVLLLGYWSPSHGSLVLSVHCHHFLLCSF